MAIMYRPSLRRLGGAVNGDILNYTLATDALKFSNVGGYAITVTLDLNPNYNVTKTDGTLTVDPRAATVVADPKSKTYGDANPALSATESGTVNGDVLNYSLSTTAQTFFRCRRLSDHDLPRPKPQLQYHQDRWHARRSIKSQPRSWLTRSPRFTAIPIRSSRAA